MEIANYIIENNATVRQTAKQFRISKSTVHKDVTECHNKNSQMRCRESVDFGGFHELSALGRELIVKIDIRHRV